jgi:hypothetical protein
LECTKCFAASPPAASIIAEKAVKQNRNRRSHQDHTGNGDGVETVGSVGKALSTKGGGPELSII